VWFSYPGPVRRRRTFNEMERLGARCKLNKPTANQFRRNALRMVVAALCLAGLVVTGFAAASSYQRHGDVRGRALRMLQMSAESKVHQRTGPKNANPTGSSGSQAVTGGAVANAASVVASFPDGQIDNQIPSVSGGVATESAPDTTTPTLSGGGGSTSDSTPPATGNVAVLTPFIDTSEFGASVGFLLACNTGVGAISASAAEVPGLSKVLAPVIAQISPLCGKLSTEAVNELTEFNDQLRVLNQLTPDTAPFFAELNNVFATLNTLAPELEPLSGTITALGPLVEFFSSEPSGS
jgi:hypothetical protein